MESLSPLMMDWGSYEDGMSQIPLRTWVNDFGGGVVETIGDSLVDWAWLNDDLCEKGEKIHGKKQG